jgi:AraC-like DNA-binding protein
MYGYVSNFGPRVHYIGSLHTDAHESFYKPMHQHPNHLEILLWLGGRGTLQVEGRTIDVAPGSLIIYNQGIWHEERGVSPLCIHYLAVSHFTVPDLLKGALVEPDAPIVYPLGDNADSLISRFQEIERYKRHHPDDPFGIAFSLCMAFLGEILSHIRPSSATLVSSPDNKAADIKRYLEEHYHEKFSLDVLARHFYLNKYYIARMFKKEFGTSPNHYVIGYRMNVAKRYLETTDDSVETITAQVGYQSETHFQNIFKKIVRLTPGQYRLQHQVDRKQPQA